MRGIAHTGRFGWFFSLPLLAPQVLAASQDPESRSRVRVLAIGDTGDAAGSGEVAEALLSRVKADRTDALVFLGDNFYPRGLNRKHWQSLLKVVNDPFCAAIQAVGTERVHAVAGNHDYYSYSLLGIKRLPMGFSTLGNERAARQSTVWHYHYWWTDDAIVRSGDGSIGLQIVFLDSARPLAMGPSHTPDVFDRLREALARHRADPQIQWRVIVAHHPLETVGEHGNLGEEPGLWRRIRARLLGGQDTSSSRYQDYRCRVLDAINESNAKVSAFVAGHDHSLQLLNRVDTNCPECPTVHIVAGSGSKQSNVRISTGADYTPITTNTHSRKSPKGFVELNANARALEVRFFGEGDMPERVRMGPAGDICGFSLAVTTTAITTLNCGP